MYSSLWLWSNFLRNKGNVEQPSEPDLEEAFMKALFCEHPNKPLRGGYCSYYSEIFHALKGEFDIEFKNFIPRKTSEFGDYDVVFLGFGHTDCSDGKPASLERDSNHKLFPILNKEYTGLNNKLDWIREMRATAALTVHHDVDKFMSQTSIPFYRIMWSANRNQFKDYGGDYQHDLFFSGVTRPEQSENPEKEFFWNWIDSMVI